jgi:hypothetical protein
MAGEKFLKHDAAGGFVETVAVQTGGAPSADKVPSLNAAGQFDATMMPTGIGADTSVIPAVGALAAGDFVNVYNDAGTARVRKADASAAITAAHGFVLEAFSDLANATVYWEGTNGLVTGQTPGAAFLSTVGGDAQAAAPTGSGEIVQRIGIATSATSINFEPQTAILLA